MATATQEEGLQLTSGELSRLEAAAASLGYSVWYDSAVMAGGWGVFRPSKVITVKVGDDLPAAEAALAEAIRKQRELQP